MSITSKKITATTVLAGGAPERFLPVKSYDHNLVVDDLTNLDDTVTTLTDGTADFVGDTITLTGAAKVGVVTENHTASAINATATATATQMATGLITSTSAAATAITFPTAAALLAAIGGAIGSSFELIVDNSAGANTVTMTASATITAATAVITGGATLTVASGATGIFKIYFTSATAAKVYRIG